MAPVSPWFFTVSPVVVLRGADAERKSITQHYGPNSYNKNFIYRSDDWLLMERWELLIQNRDAVNIAQIITWNDYGESHYVGRIAGALPNSQAWTIGFDHQGTSIKPHFECICLTKGSSLGWLELLPYYITAYKTGSYPDVARDRIILWARLYPAAANAPDDVGRPAGWENVSPMLFVAFLHSDSPSRPRITCGPLLS
jgi:glucan endo-1,3-alpha-glucosidase